MTGVEVFTDANLGTVQDDDDGMCFGIRNQNTKNYADNPNRIKT